MRTIKVSSAQELTSALATAQGGDRIELAAGDYGSLALDSRRNPNLDFNSTVTITSANPDHPAVFSGLNLRDVGNLAFDSVIFDYTFKAGDEIYSRPFNVTGGHDITIRNSTFDGDVAQGVSSVDDGYGYAIGLSLRGVTGAVVEGNEFFDYHRGLAISESSAVSVTNNDIHSIRTDGMDFSEVVDVVIEGNYIHDFKGSPTSADHCDMIQFWTNGTDSPSSDIRIQGNVLDIGNGSFTQSIFMRNDLVDRGLAGAEMFYRNVTISENVITNGHAHGITVGETAGLTITHNTVVHADGNKPDGIDSTVEIPRINVAESSTGVTIAANITSAITGWNNQGDWAVGKNAFVQDQNPGQPGYYNDVFISSSLTANENGHHFIALPGGMIDRLAAGSTATYCFNTMEGEASALYTVTEGSSGSVQTRVFDAGLSRLDNGPLPQGTICEWSFGDGTKAVGQQVSHSFAKGGQYDVQLTLHLPDGQSIHQSSTVQVQDSILLRLGNDGLFHTSENAVNIALAANHDGPEPGLQLGGAGIAMSIDRAHVAGILNAKDFNISLQIEADKPGSTGEIFRLHGGIVTSVNAEGEIFIQASSSEGASVRLTTTGVSVNDQKPHDIDITLENGQFIVSVDGTVAASTAFEGTLAPSGTNPLTFGNPWGKANFHSDLTAFEISIGKDSPQHTETGAAQIQDPHDIVFPFPEAPPTTSSDDPGHQSSTAIVPDISLLRLGKDGLFHTSGNTVDIALSPDHDGPEPGIQLGGTGIAMSIDRAHVADILNAKDFNISLQIEADKPGSTGEIFRLHGGIVTSVNAKGEIFIQASSSEGDSVRLTTTGVSVNDQKPHDIDITLENGQFMVSIDGTVAASTAFEGTLASYGNLPLSFGNAWGKTNFHSDLTAFEITVGEHAPQDGGVELVSAFRYTDDPLAPSHLFHETHHMAPPDGYLL